MKYGRSNQKCRVKTEKENFVRTEKKTAIVIADKKFYERTEIINESKMQAHGT